jgi:hypothetical protein
MIRRRAHRYRDEAAARVRHQAAVVAPGQQALAGGDLDELLDAAVRSAARELDADYAWCSSSPATAAACSCAAGPAFRRACSAACWRWTPRTSRATRCAPTGPSSSPISHQGRSSGRPRSSASWDRQRGRGADRLERRPVRGDRRPQRRPRDLQGLRRQLPPGPGEHPRRGRRARPPGGAGARLRGELPPAGRHRAGHDLDHRRARAGDVRQPGLAALHGHLPRGGAGREWSLGVHPDVLRPCSRPGSSASSGGRPGSTNSGAPR